MSNSRASGFTLIEMVIAIVIIGVGLAGVLAAFNVAVRSSADPMVRKQLLAAAEEMMEEILAKPFTPPAGGVTPVNALVACGAGANRANFDDVMDYNGYATTGICGIDGAGVAGLGTYSVVVAVDNTAAACLDALCGPDVMRVAVTVTGPGEAFTLIGWRTNYGAGAPP